MLEQNTRGVKMETLFIWIFIVIGVFSLVVGIYEVLYSLFSNDNGGL